VSVRMKPVRQPLPSNESGSLDLAIQNALAPPRQKGILFALAGDARKASSRVRGYWVVEELQALGVSCSSVVATTRRGLLRLLLRIPRHDVIVFQKVFSRWHLQILAVASRLAKTTVLDLDDWPSSSNHPRTLQNAASMMASSTAVVAGSRKLLQFAREHQSNS
jgi:hypothetical protein